MGPMRKSRLSSYKQDRLIEHFVAGTTARTASRLCGVNRKTAAFYFLRLREIIAIELEEESEAMFGGEIEVDESYFGGKRKGKRGRGAAGKIPVFGLLKRGGRVYTKIIPDASSATLLPTIERRVIAESGVLVSESSGDQIALRHLNTIFELYPSYHLGQVVEAAQTSPLLFRTLTKLEHHVQHAVTRQASF